MADLEKVIIGLECWTDDNPCITTVDCMLKHCPYAGNDHCDLEIFNGALELLKAQEPRVMTLEEVIKHYSLPPVFVDDFDEQEDYLEDIKPLYFDYLDACPWYVHWRGYCSARTYIGGREASYGVTWRCWTDKPTDEQRKTVKWNEVISK